MAKKKTSSAKPVVGIIMGSISDWETMQHAAERLDFFGISYEKKIVSAHRTPELLFKYAAIAANRGLKLIIAGAGGAAHLPGMTAAISELPVLGVPVESRTLKGLDSLLSIAQMPAGIPVATFAVGKAGAINSALAAVSILALHDEKLAKKLTAFRKQQTNTVLKTKLPK
ncbi:MAG: 5-(carboxyamino)imidazole ribonucleotide mutase [Verrucomicrobiales bacterium]|jgi:5-(carboxyamino)imidazole ribonucleotide mutase|nr:5-(carboxyamino)imidazole ribonucleotide mutase [Verrucomicrobiales bacterium]